METEQNYTIEFENVVKRFGTHTVLDDLDFKIHEGKITTLLGFSGAGKSTILKHILGIYHPTEGKVKVLGQELLNMNEKEIRQFRTQFGMSFQYSALFDSMSNYENVCFPLKEFTQMTQSQRDEKVLSLMEQVGLEEHAFHKLPSEISGGMRKRVGLARALALEPKIMLYDEPTTGLHFEDVNVLLKAINSLVNQGNTVVVIEHNLDVIKTADWIIDIGPEGGNGGGEIVASGTPAQIVKCKKSYTGKFLRDYL